MVDVFSETITITQRHLRVLINTGIETALHIYMYMALMRANQLMTVVCHLPSSGPPDLSVPATCTGESFYDSNIAKNKAFICHTTMPLRKYSSPHEGHMLHAQCIVQYNVLVHIASVL